MIDKKITEKLLKYQQVIKDAGDEEIKLKTQNEATEKRWQTEHGCKTIEDAEKLLGEFETDIKEKQEKFETKLKNVEEKYDLD